MHDLHRLANISYDYVLKLFDELRRIRKEAIRPVDDKHLSEEDEENILFLLDRIVQASAKLPAFYYASDPQAEDEHETG